MRLAIVLSLLFVTSVHAAVAVSPSEAELRQWLDEAEARARAVPMEQRRALSYSLPEDGPRLDVIRAMLQRIALWPSGTGSFHLVVAYSTPPEGTGWQRAEREAHRAAILAFVESLYRARAGLDTPEARQWQHGLAELLFNTGRFKEALEVLRPAAATAYAQILLAILEKINGNDAPFAKIREHCPEPPFATDGTGAQYCRNAIQGITVRLTTMLPAAQIPPVMFEIAGSGSWEERMHGLELMRDANNPDMLDRVAKVIADPSAPAWAVDDAIYLQIRTERTPERAIGLIDCWLARRNVRFAAADAKLWQDIAAMPDDEAHLLGAGTSNCYQHHDTDTLPPAEPGCVISTLNLRIQHALNAQDLAAARRGIEWQAAAVRNSGEGIRDLAMSIRMYALFQAPGTGESVLQYASTLQVAASSAFTDETAAAVRKQSKPAAAPWPATAIVQPACTITR